MQIEYRNYYAIGFSKAGELVERGKAHVVASIGESFRDRGLITTSSVRETLTTIDNNSNPYALGLGGRQ
jgi:hypothetical protein